MVLRELSRPWTASVAPWGQVWSPRLAAVPCTSRCSINTASSKPPAMHKVLWGSLQAPVLPPLPGSLFDYCSFAFYDVIGWGREFPSSRPLTSLPFTAVSSLLSSFCSCWERESVSQVTMPQAPRKSTRPRHEFHTPISAAHPVVRPEVSRTLGWACGWSLWLALTEAQVHSPCKTGPLEPSGIWHGRSGSGGMTFSPSAATWFAWQ